IYQIFLRLKYQSAIAIITLYSIYPNRNSLRQPKQPVIMGLKVGCGSADQITGQMDMTHDFTTF
ncbi:hypothetical protein P7K49_000188, partial [Saguinus oedipus]